MKTRSCESCGRMISVDQILHCSDCGKCYCEECARRLALCECAGDLTYYD